jgi:transcriptional regulator with XRE-family HTH domain
MSKSMSRLKPEKSSNGLMDWREERRLRAFHLKEEGWTQKAIAEELGITESAVSRLLSRAKAKPARAASEKPRPDSEAVRLILDVLRSRQWSQRRLAKEVGVDERTMRRWVAGDSEPTGPAVKLLQHLKSHHR